MISFAGCNTRLRDIGATHPIVSYGQFITTLITSKLFQWFCSYKKVSFNRRCRQALWHVIAKNTYVVNLEVHTFERGINSGYCLYFQ